MNKTTGVHRRPKILLSGFDEEETKALTKVIESKNGVYVFDSIRPQAYAPNATHLVAKNLNMTEKLMGAIVSGKWVLKPSFIYSGLNHEETHLWGKSFDSNVDNALDIVPFKWYEKFVAGHNLPFVDWIVGLFVEKRKISLFKSVIEAGGGKIMYIAESDTHNLNNEIMKKLTHIFCTDNFVSFIKLQNIVKSVLVLNEHALATYITTIGLVNLKEYAIDCQGPESNLLATFNDPKLICAVPKIILKKDKILTDKSSNSKCLSSESIRLFIQNHGDFMMDVYNKQKFLNSCFGVIDLTLLVRPYKEVGIRPFTAQEVMILEGNYEVTMDFLMGVRHMVTRQKYPEPEVIFLVMVALLNASSIEIAQEAFDTLFSILKHHPPHVKNIKRINLYQKSIGLYAKKKDITSVHAVEKIKSELRRNASSIVKHGHLWHFFVEVIESAINISDKDVKISVSSKNSNMLLDFLVSIIKDDYCYVLQCLKEGMDNPETCLIADLLWIREGQSSYCPESQEPVLTSMISLLIKSTIALGNTQSKSRELQYKKVCENISTLLHITLSWAYHIDDLQMEYPNHVPIVGVIIRLINNATQNLNMQVFQTLLEYLPKSLQPKVIAKKIESDYSNLFVKSFQTTNEAVSFCKIVNYYIHFIPHVYTDNVSESENLPVKMNQQTLQNILYKTVTPKVVKKVNKRNPKGETPLLIACRKGHASSVRNILQTPGVDPNCPDFYGWTPLGEACNYGHIECVEELLKLPVKTDKTSSKDTIDIDLCACPKKEGDTPLHDVLENNNFEIAKLLIEKGGSVLLCVQNSKGLTPLDVCSDQLRAKILNFLDTINTSSSQNIAIQNHTFVEPIQSAPDEKFYDTVLQQVKPNFLKQWEDDVTKLVILIELLVDSYITSTEMFVYRPKDMNDIENEIEMITTAPVKYEAMDENMIHNVSEFPESASENRLTKQIESDISIVLRWGKCWSMFTSHISKLISSDNVFVEDPLSSVMLQAFQEI